MACIDYNTWLAAKQACNAGTASVKGLGGPYVKALRGLGLGDINTLNVSASASDPCAIAAQTPCPQPTPPSLKAPSTPQAVCAGNPSLLPCQPGGALFCRINPSDYTCQTAPLTTVDNLTPQTPSATNTAGGFNQWGLLAALAAGGAAIYLVTRKKKGQSAS